MGEPLFARFISRLELPVALTCPSDGHSERNACITSTRAALAAGSTDATLNNGHRAAVHERLVQQETEEVRRLNLGREQVLARLWEIANLDPERTRNSASAQIKALAMIVAIEGLIPDRRAVFAAYERS